MAVDFMKERSKIANFKAWQTNGSYFRFLKFKPVLSYTVRSVTLRYVSVVEFYPRRVPTTGPRCLIVRNGTRVFQAMFDFSVGS